MVMMAHAMVMVVAHRVGAGGAGGQQGYGQGGDEDSGHGAVPDSSAKARSARVWVHQVIRR
jgi:hypothetical protein